MKATGIVRRIDDLGRIVIPKEIRRTLRIRESDPLEIYTTADGEVIFKKYSPVGEIGTFAAQYAEVLAKQLSVTALICDRDEIIAAFGPAKRECQGRHVSRPLEQIMENRRLYLYGGRGSESLYPCEGAGEAVAVAMPVLAAGDMVGAVVLLSEEKSRPDETLVKSAQIAAAFLAKQMEE